MGRVIAVGPGGRAQAPERRDLYAPVIEAVRNTQQLDKLLLSPACLNHEHADEVRRDLYRSARYYCSCGRVTCVRRYPNIPHDGNPAGGCPDGGQRISCSADVVTVTGQDGKRVYHVQFRLFDKAEAIRQVVAKYGPDPNAWPYFAKRKRAT